ncbi:MAG: thermonuclease family protein [Acidobacteria bacterium]|nr:thermonuclease family protein [Acidobacteriota bacterium]
MRTTPLAGLLIFVSTSLSFAHGGGLDAYGCHHDRKLGGYHCHRGPFAGRSFSSKEEMVGGLQQPEETRPRSQPALSNITVKVVRVVDGDTIDVCCLQGKEERVRYIGVNTPETHHPTKGIEYYGREAAAANRRLVEGKTVRLEFDVQLRDPYRRLLAYVYLEDGTFVNAWLVEHGYAQVMTVPPNVKHQDLFLSCQQAAREAGRGLWGK